MTTATRLINAARDALAQAHCPYSGLAVGAALLTPDDRIFTGCNVENASYGLTICAERNAICAAVAAGAKRFSAMAIVATRGVRPYPCGACRQVMAEFCDGDFAIYTAATGDPASLEEHRLGELLPKTFSL